MGAFTAPTPYIGSDAFSHEREERRILQLMRQAKEPSASATDHAASRTSTPASNSRRLPGLSSLLPSLQSQSSTESTGSSFGSPSTPATLVTVPRSLEDYILSHLDAIRRGFAFHRKCNRHAFVCYNEAQADVLLAQLQVDLAHGRLLVSEQLCEIYSIASVAALFNRVEIAAEWADRLYQAATERLGDWIHDDPLTGMRCCGLLGWVNLFQKAAVSVVYYDLALILAHRRFAGMGVASLDMQQPDHVEVYTVWRSIIFARSWLGSTIGATPDEAQVLLPPTTLENDAVCRFDGTDVLLCIPKEITKMSVHAAMAMKSLAACTTDADLLAAADTLNREIGSWYRALPHKAKAEELSRTPWTASSVYLSYIHLGHLGAITLIMRRALSIFAPEIGGPTPRLTVKDRAQLEHILKDGLVAAKQSSRILYLFLGEQAGIRHCWAVIYIAFVSATVLLYCICQMHLHNYPAAEWQAYFSFIENDLAMLEYCQELDPVASSLRNSVAQYMLIFQTASLIPAARPAKRQCRSATPVAMQTTNSDPPDVPKDLVSLLLTIPARPKGMAHTSRDLLTLVCRPFSNDKDRAGSTPAPHSPPSSKTDGVLDDSARKSSRPPSGLEDSLQGLECKLPFGWQRYQTSTQYTAKATEVALTVEQGQSEWLCGH